MSFAGMDHVRFADFGLLECRTRRFTTSRQLQDRFAAVDNPGRDLTLERKLTKGPLFSNLCICTVGTI